MNPSSNEKLLNADFERAERQLDQALARYGYSDKHGSDRGDLLEGIGYALSTLLSALRARAAVSAFPLREIVEVMRPFAESTVIDPAKKRGERHWATFGKPTNLDHVLALQAVFAKLTALQEKEMGK